MENNIQNKHGTAANIIIIFGITILIVTGIGILCGEEAGRISTMFRLNAMGDKAMEYETIWQFLLSSAGIVLIQKLFYSPKLFRKTTYLIRTIYMLISILFLIIAFIFLFKWFPADSLESWLSFILLFGICTGVSTAIMVVLTKKESRLLEERLENYKKERAANVRKGEIVE